nr:hypothetical protein [Arthrobacter sp. NamB2]
MRIGQPVQQGVPVLLQVDAGHLGQQGHHLVEEGREEVPHQRVAHGLHRGPVSEEETVEPESAVPGIEHPGLHRFERLDVVDELHPDLVQRGPAVAELVLDDPLRERLREDRPPVVHAESLGHGVALLRRRRGRDAVHHAGREGSLAVDPVPEVLVAQPGERDDGRAGSPSPVLHVVAGQHREGRYPAVPSTAQALHEVAEHG